MKKCPNCDEEIIGRTDKKFCSIYCKSTFHYKKNKNDPNRIFTKIDKQLRLNRALLKSFNKAGKSIVRKDKLLKEGFNPKYFTHYWKNKKAEIYLFCYEFGYLKKKERNIEKYVLVTWQPYMEE